MLSGPACDLTTSDFGAFPWTQTGFAPDGTEQDALAEYLAQLPEPYSAPETPASNDERIQNLSQVAADTVLDGCP